MKITKLVHSCIIVEKDGKKVLVDPGVYSWNSGIVEPDMLCDIDYVCITHIHADHCHPDFARVVQEVSPNALWYATHEVRLQLAQWGIDCNTESTLSDVEFVQSQHADLDPWNTQPEHTSFKIFDDLLVSGDCQTHIDMHGARILAGPINGGPWGAVVGELKMIQSLEQKPEYFVPLHDWHWSDTAREGIYAQLPSVIDRLGVTFVPVQNGVPVEL
jgi:L-ascorbate metabolism protein UlaG (beta-lactamase superfamily)